MLRLLKWQGDSLWLGRTTCDLVGKVVTSRWLCQGNSPRKDSPLILQRICTGLISRLARTALHTNAHNTVTSTALPRLRGWVDSSLSAQPAYHINIGAGLVVAVYCESMSTGTSAWASDRRKGKRDKVSGHNTTSGLESRLKACCNLAVGTISALWDLCQLGNDLFVWKLFARTAECLDEP